MGAPLHEVGELGLTLCYHFVAFDLRWWGGQRWCGATGRQGPLRISNAKQCLRALTHNHPRVCGGRGGGPGSTASRNRRKAHTTSRDVSSPGGSAAAGTGSARSEESVRTKPRRRGRGVGHVSHQCSPLVSRDGGHSRSTRQLCGRGWPKPWARAEAIFFSR